ncbi:hypothetical protein CEXT_682411 [Caerostris extrusa]|uniref:Uncharacterized protein n=1 Tax=Caerostris extrusa TaxID=172846 RepID=A0AAV4XYY0_CAEEX|nr:hypothetical protein CEXT_682411 [Caerostris extrusa]
MPNKETELRILMSLLKTGVMNQSVCRKVISLASRGRTEMRILRPKMMNEFDHQVLRFFPLLEQSYDLVAHHGLFGREIRSCHVSPWLIKNLLAASARVMYGPLGKMFSDEKKGWTDYLSKQLLPSVFEQGME